MELNRIMSLMTLSLLLTLISAAPVGDHQLIADDFQWQGHDHGYANEHNSTVLQSSMETGNVAKRWYSVFPLPDDFDEGSGYSWQAWPPIDPDDPDSETWVRYCFTNQEAKDNLFPVMAQAIARWYPTYEFSSMRIMPDPKCRHYDTSGSWSPAFDCVCSEDMDGNSIRIYDMQASDDGSKRSLATFYNKAGYDYEAPDKRWRHYIHFSGLLHGRRHDESVVSLAVHMMTHELGHAIGLMHEHQRPDAYQSIDLHPKNFPGYAKAINALNEASCDPRFGADGGQSLTAEEKMAMVCRNTHLAQSFFPEMFNYVPWDHYGVLGFGSNVDDRSIMLYESGDPPLMTKKKDASIDSGLNFYSGGHPDPAKSSISVHDIWTVARIYPSRSGTDLTFLPMEAVGEGWGTRTVEIKGLWTAEQNMEVKDSLNWALPRVSGDRGEGSRADQNAISLQEVEVLPPES